MPGDLASKDILLSGRRTKFDTKAKKRYLKQYQLTGRRHHAAQAAGVCDQTVQDHRKLDPEFDAACEVALNLYRDQLEEEVERRALKGIKEPVFQGGKQVMAPRYDENGVVVLNEAGEIIWEPAFIRRYSDRILELHAKRHIAEYRDHSRVDLNTNTGVMLVPGQQQVTDWESTYGEEKVIEGEVIDDDHKQTVRS